MKTRASPKAAQRPLNWSGARLLRLALVAPLPVSARALLHLVLEGLLAVLSWVLGSLSLCLLRLTVAPLPSLLVPGGGFQSLLFFGSLTPPGRNLWQVLVALLLAAPALAGSLVLVAALSEVAPARV